MKPKQSKNSKRKRAAGTRSYHRLVREPIMSGDGSKTLWNDIIDANDVNSLRIALYHLACKCQELESEIRRLSNVGSEPPLIAQPTTERKP